MGCLGNSKTEDQRNEEKAQREANKKIEKQLQKDKQVYRATHRLLLLGKGAAGSAALGQRAEGRAAGPSTVPLPGHGEARGRGGARGERSHRAHPFRGAWGRRGWPTSPLPAGPRESVIAWGGGPGGAEETAAPQTSLPGSSARRRRGGLGHHPTCRGRGPGGRPRRYGAAARGRSPPAAGAVRAGRPGRGAGLGAECEEVAGDAGSAVGEGRGSVGPEGEPGR